ncbi:hypothetical protein SDC9_130365 [bioreactor metagenome]|uniref:Uncharacterized protein n=1 Tax=bioreactor metagenome TaxID=1076179 RepID=A0A645D2B0_9ZZZZ
MIPSCEVPIPSSSSAQIIPILSSPRIFDLFIFNTSPPAKVRVVPTVATSTFWPAATLGAPQTMLKSSPLPTSTFVRLSLSAPGCLAHSTTSPVNTPASPPGICSVVSTDSTSRPIEVRISSICDTGISVCKYLFNQLYEIFIGRVVLKFFSYDSCLIH